MHPFALAAVILQSVLVSADPSTQTLFLNSIASSNVLVAFGSTKCPLTKSFLPVWKQLEGLQLPTVGSNLQTFLVHCDKEVDFCISEHIKYYPSIRFYTPGAAWPQVFKGQRSLQRLLSFVAKAQLSAQQPPQAEAVRHSNGVLLLEDSGGFQAATGGEPTLVKFFTDWCPHCRELRPTFERLPAAAKAAGLDVTIAAVNCEQLEDTCSGQRVQHYPLLALYAAGRRIAVYEDAHSLDGWLGFLRQRLAELRDLRRRPPAHGEVPQLFLPPASEPVDLTEGDFESTTKAVPVAFIKFFAPWCVHCQRLAPVWSQLAQRAASELGQSVLIGRVDCTQQARLCTRHRVAGYPSLLLLHRGRVADEYKGARHLSALLHFLRRWAQRTAAEGEL